MHPVAPAVDEFPAAPVQLLHGVERIPLYELLMDIFERGFHLAFFSGPVIRACIQFRPQMFCQEQRIGVISDLLF